MLVLLLLLSPNRETEISEEEEKSESEEEASLMPSSVTAEQKSREGGDGLQQPGKRQKEENLPACF